MSFGTTLMNGLPVSRFASIAFALFFLFSRAFSLNIEQVYPLPYSNHSDPFSTIQILFDQDVDQSLLNEGISVFSRSSGKISGDFFTTLSTRSVSFIPNQPFLPGDQISVTVSRDLYSTTGENLANGFQWQFRVKPLRGSGVFSPLSFTIDPDLTAICTADVTDDGRDDFAITASKDIKHY